MDRQTFEAGLKRDGYEILTNTTPGAKDQSRAQPSVRRPGAMVLKGAITITSGQAKPRPTGRATPGT